MNYFKSFCNQFLLFFLLSSTPLLNLDNLFTNSSFATPKLAKTELIRQNPAWQNDFAIQTINKRPRLEVHYLNGKREAFEILAEKYHLIGHLRTPHSLIAAETNQNWL